MSRFSNKTTGVITFMDLKRPGVKAVYILLFIGLLLLSLICLLPPFWIFLSSLKSPRELYAVPSTFFPKNFSLSKIKYVWDQMDFLHYYLNTFAAVIGYIFFTVIVNGLAGYVLSRLKPRGSALYLTIMLWTMLLPHTLNIVPLYKQMIDFFGLNLTNTYWPMWLVSAANAFYVLIFKNFFDSIPMPLIEAARLDGCGNISVFVRILLPLSMPIIGVVIIFTVTGAWGDFFLPYLVINKESMYTVMLRIYSIKMNANFSIDQQLMAVFFAILPPIVIFFFFQKYIMQGFTLSGIKG